MLLVWFYIFLSQTITATNVFIHAKGDSIKNMFSIKCILYHKLHGQYLIFSNILISAVCSYIFTIQAYLYKLKLLCESFGFWFDVFLAGDTAGSCRERQS